MGSEICACFPTSKTGLPDTPDRSEEQAKQTVHYLVPPRISAPEHAALIREKVGWNNGEEKPHRYSDPGTSLTGEQHVGGWIKEGELKPLTTGYVRIEQRPTSGEPSATYTHFATVKGATARFIEDLADANGMVLYPNEIDNSLRKPLMLVSKDCFVAVVRAAIQKDDLAMILAESPIRTAESKTPPLPALIHEI